MAATRGHLSRKRINKGERWLARRVSSLEVERYTESRDAGDRVPPDDIISIKGIDRGIDASAGFEQGTVLATV